jgi:hypothetical protein
MTRGSILEYIAAAKARYWDASKKGKGKILDEFVSNTGYHRKSAIRLLGYRGRNKDVSKRGRPKKYHSVVLSELKYLWEIMDHLCSKRLKPFIPELIDIVNRCGNRTLSAEVQVKLRELSPATIDRLLSPYRNKKIRGRFSTTKPGTLLKNCIPIRTFADWQENAPGFLEADLVAHCGDSVDGFYLYTLSTVDVATGWTECMGIFGKGQSRVRVGVHRIRQRLPFALLGLDSDNGSEFINRHMYSYCMDEKITFTRSRSYKKNDSCHVEQKNWSIIRRVIGYGRYNSRPALIALNKIYDLLRLYMNFFQPVMKIVSKTRQGARVHKIYDIAQTPYQRLLKSGILPEAKQRELKELYQSLNPAVLLQQINSSLETFWKLEEDKRSSPKPYRIHKI